MRHKYTTRALVLGRTPHGEANLLASLLTQDLGLIRARSQGARKPGAKMAAGMQTLALADVTLLRGKEGWRMAGSVLEENWSKQLSKDARKRAARVAGLAERLVRGEHADPELFHLISAFFAALAVVSEDVGEDAEALAALRLLQSLGHDAGDTFGAVDDYSEHALALAAENRTALIARINTAIAASGL